MTTEDNFWVAIEEFTTSALLVVKIISDREEKRRDRDTKEHPYTY